MNPTSSSARYTCPTELGLAGSPWQAAQDPSRELGDTISAVHSPNSTFIHTGQTGLKLSAPE
jgi:hypothetical protein